MRPKMRELHELPSTGIVKSGTISTYVYVQYTVIHI